MAEKPNVQAKAEKPVIGKKLELRKKQGTITLVTPPSFFTNQNRSFVLVNLSKKDKDNFAEAINKWFPKDDLTIYLWDDNNFSGLDITCLLYTSPSPRDLSTSRMPSSA